MNLKLHKQLMISFFIVAVPLVAFGIVTILKHKYSRLPVYNVELNGKESEEAQHYIQPFYFINQEGNKFSSNALDNKIYVADFFFTSCLSICPQMTNNLKLVQNAFKNDTEVAIVSFTVDPTRDSAAKLKQYMHHFNIAAMQWNFLTGDKKDIYRLARESFNVSASDGDGGPEDFIHSDKLVLIDRHRQIRGYYTGTDSKAVLQLIDDIKKLENEY